MVYGLQGAPQQNRRQWRQNHGPVRTVNFWLSDCIHGIKSFRVKLPQNGKLVTHKQYTTSTVFIYVTKLLLFAYGIVTQF
jgi:hypothetical protein